MFNTLQYARKLEAVGISREHAEAHIQIIAEIIEGDMATKSDIRELENKLVQLEYRLVVKLGAIVVTATTLAVALTSWLMKLH